MSVPVLFQNKSECCACGACVNICPVKAITMKEDEYGFIYPEINESVCLGCGKCKKVCRFQNGNTENEPIKTFAAVSKDLNISSKSSSGGIFASIATEIIKKNGIVFGVEMMSDFSVRHSSTNDQSGISKFQGSKYTQSDTHRSYEEVAKHLKEGKIVFFSGTPCQIDGLYGYLGRDYENLYTADLICHGVPNNKMLKDYLSIVEEKNNGKISYFTFRDKSLGWGKNGYVIINGKKIKMWQSSSSYIYYFSQGWICRENCYKCKYTCSHRPADITLGDYWGIEKYHPEYLGGNNWDESKGISVIIVNSDKGMKLIENFGTGIELKASDFEKAAAGNSQLRHPSKPGKRDEILEIYKKDGWKAVDERFKKNVGIRYYSSQIKSLLPLSLKRRLKSLLK